MNKELESLERLAMPDELHIEECEKLGIDSTEDYEIVKQALLELKAIKESNPSRAIEYLENLGTHRIEYTEGFELGFTKTMPLKSTYDYNIIHQTLIKAQEQEKTLKIIFEKNVDIMDVKIYESYEHYCRAKEDSKLRKDWWLTQKEFNLLKRKIKHDKNFR